MNLTQLKYFKTVVEQGGVHKASERLHISQPAITTAIKKLETSLNVTLFEKDGRKVKPTTAGIKLYQHACQLLAHSQNIISDMQAEKGLVNEVLTIYTSPIIAQNFLQNSLQRIIKLYPNTKVKMVIQAGVNIQYALLNDEAEVGFSAHTPSSASINSLCFYKENLKLILRANHPLVNTKTLTWQHLLEHELATLPSPYMLKSELNKVSDYYKIPLKIRLETDSLANIINTISNSELIAILPESVAQECDSLTSLNLPIDTSASLNFKGTVDLHVLTKASTKQSDKVKTLIEDLITNYQNA